MLDTGRYLVRIVGLFLAIAASGAYVVASPFCPTGVAGSAVSAVILAGCLLSWPRIPGQWRKDPPTDRQIEYARSLGIAVPNGFTKGQLSELISAARGRSDA